MLEALICIVVLGGCAASIAWLYKDILRQEEAQKERCESLEEDEE